MKIHYAECSDRMTMALISRGPIKKSPGFSVGDVVSHEGTFEVPDGTQEIFFDSGYCTFVLKQDGKYV